jgi:hypothetical protein
MLAVTHFVSSGSLSSQAAPRRAIIEALPGQVKNRTVFDLAR